MINPITPYCFHNTQIKNNSRPAFGAQNVVGKYVKPIKEEHLPLLDKLADFFAGTTRMLQTQHRQLATKSGALKVRNIAQPVPEGRIEFDAFKWISFTPKKFRTSDAKKIDLCHIEYVDPPKCRKFDIVMTDSPRSPKKGDIFLFNSHRADRTPIREQEAEEVNNFLARFGDDISRVIRKYDKKLQ